MINVDCSSRTQEEALQALCLEDVWRFYVEPSLYGREVGCWVVCVFVPCVCVGGWVAVGECVHGRGLEARL